MKDLMQIAIILDRSGSMASVKEATIESFNGFIDKQQQSGDNIDLLFVQFDTLNPYEVVSDSNINDANKLTSETYVPRGGTPLHDAMGKTIVTLGERLSKLSEQYRPKKVMVVILTDGEENASVEFNHQSIAALVKQQTEVYNWTFLFLAANQDAVLTASTYNISANTSLTYSGSITGMRSAVGALSTVTDLWKYSNSSADIKFTEEDRTDAQQ